MGDRRLRRVQRFDYKRFHTDGVKVPLPAPDSEMTTVDRDPRVAKVTGELSGLVFQVDEILDDLENLNNLSLDTLRSHLEELKGLRINIVKVSSELKLLMSTPAEAVATDEEGAGASGAGANAAGVSRLLQRSSTASTGENLDVSELMERSKKMISTLRSAIDARQNAIDRDQFVVRQNQDAEKEATKRERKFAFDKMIEEVISLSGSLQRKYDIRADSTTLTAEVVSKRKTLKTAYASEYSRLVSLVDRLLQYTDVQFAGKESLLNQKLQAVTDIEHLKRTFEDKLCSDLEYFDLSDQKLKLATLTKVDIGKFDGSFEKGSDFYSFKTKFQKAYANHPKKLLVEWLVNNHLGGQAKECVGSLEDLDEIWQRLKKTFGNTEQMLRFQIAKMKQIGPIGKAKGWEVKRNNMQKLVNTVEDVYNLAMEHGLTGELFYGNHLPKVVHILEKHVQDKWYKIVVDERLTKPGKWPRLLEFLGEELEVVQERYSEMLEMEEERSDNNMNRSHGGGSGGSGGASGGGSGAGNNRSRGGGGTFLVSGMCVACEEKQPNASGEFVQCRKFLLLSPREKSDLVRKKKCCLQCLDGTVKWDSNHDCADAWVCPHVSHDSYQKKLHFLLCDRHCDDDANKKLFDLYKQQILKADWQKKLYSSIFVTQTILHAVETPSAEETNNDVPTAGGDVVEAAAYMLQTCSFYNETYSCMYDSGCRGFVVRDAAVDKLPEEHKTNSKPGPLIIGGVGGTTAVSGYGEFTVGLPTHDGKTSAFTGISLPVITGTMPPYPVKEARKAIVADWVEQGGKEKELPDVPATVGGETDFLIGIQYNWFLPRLIHILPTSLAVYKSMFVGVDGTRGCIGGSHEVFLQCERRFYETESNVVQFRVFLQQQLSLFNSGFRVCLDVSEFSTSRLTSSVASCIVVQSQPAQVGDGVVSQLDRPAVDLHEESDTAVERNVVIVDESSDRVDNKILLSAKVKFFNEVEGAGSSIEYRCISCRGCGDCRKGDYTEKISFKEEREQDLINNSVSVDFANGVTTAVLPFVSNPEDKLVYNRDVALKVYNQQLKKLSRETEKREGVIHSEGKLQSAGHVDWVSNISNEVQVLLPEGQGHYFPWRVVENENSLSTPIRLVFDASMATKSGYSLNDIVAKGINSMNSMVEIVIRFRSYKVTVHTDVKQMYNVVKLRPEHWKFQRYLWDALLDPNNEPSEKVIKTIIYGVKSSGNQAQYGLRQTAGEQRKEFPEAAACVIDDSFVDDIATGSDVTSGEKLAADMTALLAGGGFATKGFTISGLPPPPELTKDGVSVNVLGTKWCSEEDQLLLAVGKLNFSKRVRGKKRMTDDAWVVPAKLTKRICMGKVAEIYDIIGFISPITAGFKLDIRSLVSSSYSWDDPLTALDRELWIQNFQLMESLSDGVWPRRAIPEDCVEIELIGCGDASESIACAVCYARVLKKDGTYACQLLMSKTKIVPQGMTPPKAELMACALNVHVTEIVKRALRRLNIKNVVYVLDSEISLHWIASECKRLKPGTRNLVIEIRRFSSVDQWNHVVSELNPADIGTRKGAVLSDVNDESEWIRGMPWMCEPWVDLLGSTLKNVHQVKLKNEQLAEVKKEHAKPLSDLCDTGCDLTGTDNCLTDLGDTDHYMTYTDENILTDDPHKHTDSTDDALCYLAATGEITAKTRERLAFSKYIIDPNKHNFARVVRVVAIVIKCCRSLLSLLKCSPKRGLKRFPEAPADDDNKFVVAINNVEGLCLTDGDIQHGLNYFFKKTTEEVKSYVHPKIYEKDSFEKDDILFYAGRVTNSDITYECELTSKMIDLSRDSFVVPIVDRHSPVAYALVNQFHWEDDSVKHSGIETTIRAVMAVAHILRVRDLVKTIKKNCKRCRYLLKRTIDVMMGPASKDQLCVAPPFYITQVDLCGPFNAYPAHSKRAQKVKVYIATFVCCTTGMTSCKLMQGYDTAQFLHCFNRFACELGYPKKLLTDKGSQLVCGCENVVLNISNIAGVLNRKYGIEFSTCPVGGHNFNGRAERKIRTIQEVMNKTIQHAKLTILEWETLIAEIANSINNLPVAIGNETDELESVDLITPNRLRLGRNNQRSPVGPLEVTGKIERLLQLKTDVFEAWWNAWLTSAIPKLMPRPKWFVNDRDVSVGDVVIFNKGSDFLGEYKFGMVSSVTVGPDGHIRSAKIRYRNASENSDQITHRAVRSLVIIHRVDEIDLMEELGNAANYADNYCYIMGFPWCGPGV